MRGPRLASPTWTEWISSRFLLLLLPLYLTQFIRERLRLTVLKPVFCSASRTSTSSRAMSAQRTRHYAMAAVTYMTWFGVGAFVSTNGFHKYSRSPT